ncbi:MAG: hypothetical protein JWO36_1768 [Myxococcales bacterium]|nr:hypothetical protein [Myxococcales bacterium]
MPPRAAASSSVHRSVRPESHYRWEDGLPTTTSENAEIKEHVLNALLWLRHRVLQHATWRCTRALKTAVAEEMQLRT